MDADVASAVSFIDIALSIADLFNAACSAALAAVPAWNLSKGPLAAKPIVWNMFPAGALPNKSNPKEVKNPGPVPGANKDCSGTPPYSLYALSVSSIYGFKFCETLSPSLYWFLGWSSPDVIPVPAEPPLLNIGLLSVLFIV